MFTCRLLQKLDDDLSFRLHRMFALMSTCVQNLPWPNHQTDAAANDAHLGAQINQKLR